MLRKFVFISVILLAWQNHAAEVRPPKVLAEGWRIELIDQEPNLVTPVSCRFDSKGNLYVVECHTHMPPDNYSGPKVDRVYIYYGRKADGTFSGRKIFYEGSIKSMGLAVDDSGWVYIASRSEIIRVRDNNADNVSDEKQVIISHQTKADYPHNGLSGLALQASGYPAEGKLYFGQGENFGEKFVIAGTDGSKQQGSGEGGSVYSCNRDGSNVQRVATGIWNPFGLAFDQHQRLWCVDNDPDSRPPCRLLHIVPTGDYGFQFRFGRAGTNPLLAWDGELPGTLPMAAGTGEAPCEVIQLGDSLLVSSWGDNRIEQFKLQPKGATAIGRMEVLVQGDADFRPVSFAIALDGSVFITDWVDRSYPVHGKGRLWRLVPPANFSNRTLPPPGVDELLAEKISNRKASEAELRTALASNDPFLKAAATWERSHHSEVPWPISSEAERLENLRIMRWKSLTSSNFDRAKYLRHLSDCLQDTSLDMRLLAIRYAAESYEKPLINNLESLLSSPQLKASEFHHLISALSFLRTGSASGAKRDPARDQLLIDFFKDNTKPVALRQLALRQLPSSSKAIDSKSLLDLIKDSSLKELHRDALAMLIARHEESTIKILDDLLLSNETQASFRADILASLVSIPSWCDAWSDAKQAQLLSVSPDKNFAIEVQRVARAIRNLPAQDAQRPKRDSIDQWIKLINGGDALRGWRVWARSQCVQCHMMDGRGAELGPDLTALQAASDRKRTLQSMLEPSREVAPLFATWQILTTDGRVLVGAKLNGGGVGTNLRFLASDGKVFEVALSEIETQRLSFKSIMPDDITDKLTIDEIQDLLEYLSPSSSH